MKLREQLFRLPRYRIMRHAKQAEITGIEAAVILAAFRFGLDTARIADAAGLPEYDVERAIHAAREQELGK